MKHVFATHYNQVHQNVALEAVDPLSQTQPDQTFTVRQILERHARGLPLGGVDMTYDSETDPFFHEDQSPGTDPRTLDLSERIENAREARELLKKARKKKPVTADDNPSPTTPDPAPAPDAS